MRDYSYLLFLSSILAAENNTLAHKAQDHLNIQPRTIALSLSPPNAIATD